MQLTIELSLNIWKVFIPFQISFVDLCDESTLFKQFREIDYELKDYLKSSCRFLYEVEFKDKYPTRGNHEQLSSNDCFTVLKQKHEFITYYDLDDFVFPRTLETVKDFNKTIYSCKSYIPICSVNPFQNNFKTNLFYCSKIINHSVKLK